MVAKKPMPMPMPGGMPMGGGAPNPMPPGSPPAAAQGGEGGSSPEQVRAAIMTVLQRAKALADKFGIDLNELVAELGAGRGRGTPPPPPGGMMPPGGGMMG